MEKDDGLVVVIDKAPSDAAAFEITTFETLKARLSSCSIDPRRRSAERYCRGWRRNAQTLVTQKGLTR